MSEKRQTPKLSLGSESTQHFLVMQSDTTQFLFN